MGHSGGVRSLPAPGGRFLRASGCLFAGPLQ
jgi:hypothetical protein